MVTRRLTHRVSRRGVGRRHPVTEQGTVLQELEFSPGEKRARLAEDVTLLREHPHVKGRALVGGFLYDVDTGALTQVL